MVLPGFEVIEEARGIHPVYGAVRVDFLCFPKANAASCGWPRRWFGIETKSEHLADQRKRTAALLVRQARIYRESTYDAGGDEIRPLFMLYCPPISTCLGGCDESRDYLEGYACALDKIAGFDRIGSLELFPAHWTVRFHHAADLTFDSRRPVWRNIAQISTKKVASR
jgi:hypothetical protein